MFKRKRKNYILKIMGINEKCILKRERKTCTYIFVWTPYFGEKNVFWNIIFLKNIWLWNKEQF